MMELEMRRIKQGLQFARKLFLIFPLQTVSWISLKKCYFFCLSQNDANTIKCALIIPFQRYFFLISTFYQRITIVVTIHAFGTIKRNEFTRSIHWEICRRRRWPLHDQLFHLIALPNHLSVLLKNPFWNKRLEMSTNACRPRLRFFTFSIVASLTIGNKKKKKKQNKHIYTKLNFFGCKRNMFFFLFSFTMHQE